MFEISALPVVSSISSAMLIAEYGILYERHSISRWTLGLNSLNFIMSLAIFLNGSFFHMLLAALSMTGVLVILKNVAEGDNKAWTRLLFGSKTVGATSFTSGSAALTNQEFPSPDLLKTRQELSWEPVWIKS